MLTLNVPFEFFMNDTMNTSTGSNAEVRSAIAIDKIDVMIVLVSLSYGFRYRLTYIVEKNNVT